MAMVVTLMHSDGRPITRIADPSGGTFDAAGDFDALLDSHDLAMLGAIDPYDTTEVGAGRADALLTDVDCALEQGPEGQYRRGLLRLKVMAEMCLADGSLVLRFVGD